ncbi:crustacean hyperglycemic hormones 4-like [Penaeus monodon]|uniref:crustacean hyperglycemic hormones 4-like n=1 Tax=Penaeus monodon TaxID=6687 RepID=UPI0018A7DB09|nr:crustacean hyperglycemic hormones 4-like [Penaeus monodon]
MATSLMLSAVSAALLVLAASPSPASARSLDASPSSASSGNHSLSKRSLFDPACTGIYDRQLLGKLGRLCDDCYNVFREPKVATGCRSNCYYNLIFLDCLEYLIPSHLQEEHMEALQTVGK